MADAPADVSAPQPPAAEQGPSEPQAGDVAAPGPSPQSEQQPQAPAAPAPEAEEPAAAAAPPAAEPPTAEAAPAEQPEQEAKQEAAEQPAPGEAALAEPQTAPKEEEQAQAAGDAAVEGAAASAEAGAAAGPPSDAALVARLKELLAEVDLATTTEKQLRKRLEGEFGCGLGDRKALLRAEINAYLEAQDGGEEEEEEEEEEVEEEEEEETSGGGRKRRGGSGASLGSFLSPEMQEFLGEQRLPRTQVVKRLWAYIKDNGLQDPKDKRNIIFDDKLKALFPGTKTTMFKLQKLLSKHCKTSDVVGGSDDEEDEEEEEAGSGDEAPAPKRRRASSGGAARSGSRSGSRRKSQGGGEGKAPNPNNPFTKQLNLSPEMAAWIGKPTASRPEVTKFFWAYCKEKGLQDPADRSVIVADDALRGLTGEERFKGFGFSKLVKQHLLG